MADRPLLLELTLLFLKLGTIGFGGPQAHLAMMEEEAVQRRQWLTPEEFSEGIALCEMLPGPASTQMGIYIGYRQAGWIGGVVSGVCFIAPAFAIVVALAWAYFRFQTVPSVQDLFLGAAPAVTAIIVAFCLRLSQRVLKEPLHWGLAIGALILTLSGILPVFLILLLAGAVSWLWAQRSQSAWLPLLPAAIGPTDFWGWAQWSERGAPLFRFFLETGTFVFGGGLVIIPLLQQQVVQQWQWLTAQQFVDGVAIGQLSPGPVVLTAAFIGFAVAGLSGAATATVGIFLPSFLFILLAAPILQRLRQNRSIQQFLRGVSPAVLGAIAATLWPLARPSLQSDQPAILLFSLLLFAGNLLALVRWKRPTWQVVLVGIGLGFVVGPLL
ncbi:chromate efflux transporter [Synechococcus elongatus]|uniref:chromate efflux transporter n=1 Tax=Synechococcus elongatus TaxID=32046 RepID=UPI000F7DADFA|nr:chromate efflux transporter [Synechococcus elongatus]